MAYIKSFPDQNYVVPPRLTDLFSEDHVCFLIKQIADGLDYSEFDIKYSGVGHPAYHPRICLKLLMLANIDGIKSSRRIAKNAQENVVYIYLAEKAKPDFRTLCNFRKDNPDLVREADLQLKKFAIAHGLIDLSHLMIDGTSIKADANNDRILDKETIEKLKRYIDRQIQEGIKVDEEEDKLYGDRSFHELPEDFNDREKRRPIVRKIVDEINKSIKENKKGNIKKIKKSLENVETAMQEQGLKKYSFTDPDSRFMNNKKGKFELCYNAQVMVDKNGIIVCDDVSQCAVDRNELVPAVNTVEKNFGKLKQGTKLLADGGYDNGEAMEELDKRGFDLFIPGKSKAKGKYNKANFAYDEEKDIYTCPENKILKLHGTYFHKKRQEHLEIYKCQDCRTCPHQKTCCKSANYRTVIALPQDKLFQRIKKKLQTPDGKAIYRLRKQTVETAFADLKHNKKFRNFLLRGLEKVKIEFNLACIAHNLVKINNLIKTKGISLANTC
ncbi:MAG: IS1182 family transposase [Candidatus Woesearchaeota archaeon]